MTTAIVFPSTGQSIWELRARIAEAKLEFGIKRLDVRLVRFANGLTAEGRIDLTPGMFWRISPEEQS